MNIFKKVWTTVKQFVIAVVMMITMLFTSPLPVHAAELTVEFTAVGDDGNVGTASEYLVYYSTTEFDAFTFDALLSTGIIDSAHFCADPQVAGTLEHCTLTGLAGNTQYFIALKVADEVPNWSNLSNVATMLTLDETPPGTIIDLNVLTP